MFETLVGLGLSSCILSSVFSTSIHGAVEGLTRALAPLKDAFNAVESIGELTSLDVYASTLHQILRVSLESFQAIFDTMTGQGRVGWVW